MSDELEPYVIYRLDQQQASFATWRLEQGHEALALFLSAESAAAYQAAAQLNADWTIMRAGREQLIQILSGCQQSDIRFAVLDPNSQQAKRIFDIPKVLEEARRQSDTAS
jgi:hypothetical protein